MIFLGDGEFGLLIWLLVLSFCDKIDDNEDVICLDYFNLLVMILVVVIMLVVMEECVDEGKIIVMVDMNGDFFVIMLVKDFIDICFLLSYGFCLENEIFIDDEL